MEKTVAKEYSASSGVVDSRVARCILRRAVELDGARNEKARGTYSVDSLFIAAEQAGIPQEALSAALAEHAAKELRKRSGVTLSRAGLRGASLGLCSFLNGAGSFAVWGGGLAVAYQLLRVFYLAVAGIDELAILPAPLALLKVTVCVLGGTGAIAVAGMIRVQLLLSEAEWRTNSAHLTT